MTGTSRCGKSKMLFQISVLLIALAMPFFILSSPFSVNGQLHVSGLQLVNECGSPVQLRGVSSHGLQWYGVNLCMDYCCINTSALDYLANTVGIDVFRIACYPEQDGYIANPSRFTAQVDSIVKMCEDRGIYALIDWHILQDGDPNTNIVYARTFWESMATAHKDSRNVIYEICNEPNGAGTWSQVVTYAKDIIPRIRAIDPDAVIIVGTPIWSQLGSEVVNNKLPYTNIMYTFHFYSATHDTSMLTNYIGQLPIFVTEWAPTEASGAGATDYTRADSFISIMGGANSAGVKISWCAWSWSEAPETSGLLAAGSCDSAQWSNHKPAGNYVLGKVSNPADAFTPCAIAINTATPVVVPTEVIPATDLRLDSMTDGDYISNICSNWYSYDDSNDCTDKDCVANPHGNSSIVPWSKDHWQDLGRPVQNFYMQQPGHNGAGDYAARITGVVTTTFLYGFAGLGFPLKEPEGPVDIHTATGLSFWCKSNESRTYRLKINSPQAFGGALDADMYGYVFTATTSWQKVSIDFASILFSQEGWGTVPATKAQALSAVDTIQWQTQGQTGAPYNYDLWVDDVVLINAPAALKTIATAGCGPATTPTNTFTKTFTRTATKTFTLTPTRTLTWTPAITLSSTPTFIITGTFTRTQTGTPTGTYTRTSTLALTPSNTHTQTAQVTDTFTATKTLTMTVSPQNTFTKTYTPVNTKTSTFTRTFTPTCTLTLINTPTCTPTKTATSGAYLAIQLIVTPDTVNAGQTITVIMVVTNTGNAAADSVLPSALTVAGTGGVSALVSPASAVSIPAAGTASFTWTYNADSSGIVSFQGSASGIDAAGAWVVASLTAASNMVAIGVPLPTRTLTIMPTLTNTPANTHTRTPTAVNTPANTFTTVPTNVDTPTNTFTTVPTTVNTPVNTITVTRTAINTPVNTVTVTQTAVDTPANTLTPTAINTPAVSLTPTSVATYTPTGTPIAVFTAIATLTATPADAENFKITDVLIYPNPYNPELGMPLTIRADFSQKHRKIKVKLYTPSLRCIRTFDFPDSPWAGERSLSVASSGIAGLANGNYYYIITAENEKGEKAKSKIPSLIILK